MKKFDQDDVADKPHPKELTNAILSVILAWPKLEIGLTNWIGFVTGVRPSETAILLGTMDTKTKINKLKLLHTHRKDGKTAALLKQMGKDHKERAKARNLVAHALLMGASKKHPQEAWFLPTQAAPDQHGIMKVARVPIADLEAAAAFATDTATGIRERLKRLGAKDEQ